MAVLIYTVFNTPDVKKIMNITLERYYLKNLNQGFSFRLSVRFYKNFKNEFHYKFAG